MWYDVIELICTIISTLTVISSSLAICYHFFYNIRIYAIYKDSFLMIYAYVYKKKLELIGCEIYYNKSQLNKEDSFFSNGKNVLSIDVNEDIMIKQIKMDMKKTRRLRLTIYTACGQKFKRRCFIREIDNAQVYR